MVVPLTLYAFFNEKALNVMPNHEPSTVKPSLSDHSIPYMWKLLTVSDIRTERYMHHYYRSFHESVLLDHCHLETSRPSYQ